MTSTRFRLLACAALLVTAATLVPDSADAQGRRGPRRVAGPRGGVVVAAYYSPWFYDPFYSPWYPYGSDWYPPPYGYAQYYDRSSSLRLQVMPREAEVFVDGYYAGTVYQFDGMFQRLHLDQGEHEVTLYLSGSRTVTQKIYLQPTGSFRIRHTMEALPAGAPAEPRPVPLAPPPQGQPRAPQGQPGGPPPQAAAPAAASATFGGIAIRAQPADADVLIDGERWEGPAVDEALIVQVAPGTHRIEIRKDGYRSYTTEVDVRAGQTTPINVSLPTQ